MAVRLQKFLCVLLGLLVAFTALLYLTANADQISSALQALQSESAGEEIPEPVSTPLRAVPEPPEPKKAPAEPEPPLPQFAYPYLLRGFSSEVRQALVVLAEGDRGNLWLVRRSATGWDVMMGPVHCRTGAQGLTLRKQEGDQKTPVGTSSIGGLYTADANPETSLKCTLLQPGDAWGTDPQSEGYNRLVRRDSPESGDTVMPLDRPPYLDVGFNSECRPGSGSAVLLFAQEGSTPTQGGIALEPRELARLLTLLDAACKPATAIFRASDAGWTVEQGMPEQFVFLTDAAPDVREESRYATDNNFMGRSIAGYLGLRVVVTKEVAAALQQAAEQLASQGLGLLVYDGYRPKRAVDDIFRWINDDSDQTMKQRFYPELEKRQLPGIYLDRNSPHSTGIAVDLTLCDETGLPLDMGTEFDFFSPRSWTGSAELTQQQKNNRRLLRQVMAQAGFSPYSNEWWHFNYNAGSRAVVYDFVIAQ